MRRESSEEIAAIAHQRLERLGRELGRPASAELAPANPSVVPEPGRHSRRRSLTLAERLSGSLARRLPALAGTIRLGARHLTVLLAATTVALALTAWWAVRGSAEPVPVAPARTEVASTTAPSPTSPAASPAASSAAPSAAASAGTVMVHVAGRVRRPGVVTLPSGSRVIEALRRAGGARRGVDLSGVNLARILTDGEQILVGAGPRPGAAPSTAADLGAGGAPAAGTVNVNTADATALESLPGIGPVTAEKIVAWRTEHGAFTSLDELLEVDGIGPKTLADLAPQATL